MILWHQTECKFFIDIHVPRSVMRPVIFIRVCFVLFGLSLINVTAQAASSSTEQFPDVLAAKVTPRGGNVFDFDVSVSSPHDSPQRYADGFRVTDKKGRLLGERKLWHDHAGEQPFTRDLYGVSIPSGMSVVIIQARDQKDGYGGKKIEVSLPGR